MATAVAANTTCDIYRNGHAPPEVPAVAGVRCFLLGDYERRMNTGEQEQASLRFTHVLLVDAATDIRDGISAFIPIGGEDSVYVPDQNGTRFRVVFVELQGRGCLPVAKRYTSIATNRPGPPTTCETETKTSLR